VAQQANDASGVKALAFDVFGTVVGWNGSVLREVKAHYIITTLSNSSTRLLVNSAGTTIRTSRANRSSRCMQRPLHISWTS
jgi:hypothetical protein